MCSLSVAERLHPCVFFVLSLLSCASVASADTVVRRENPHHAGTSVSDQVYEHELLHEGTVQGIREAMKKSKNPYQVAGTMVEKLPPSLQEIALHEAESLAENEIESRAPQGSMLDKERWVNPYLKEVVDDTTPATIHIGSLVTLNDAEEGYLTSTAAACPNQPVCPGVAAGAIAGCAKLTKNEDDADPLHIKEIGNTRSDNAITAGGTVSLMSSKLNTSSHGYYLGICKETSDASNGELYWFKQEHGNTVLHNSVFILSWVDPSETSMVLKSLMSIRLRSGVHGGGYLLAETAGAGGQDRIFEKTFDLAVDQDLEEKSLWILKHYESS